MNDLTNRELIRRKFTFAAPNFERLVQNQRNFEDFDDQDDALMEGSVVLHSAQNTQGQAQAGVIPISDDITGAVLSQKEMFDKLN